MTSLATGLAYHSKRPQLHACGDALSAMQTPERGCTVANANAQGYTSGDAPSGDAQDSILTGAIENKKSPRLLQLLKAKGLHQVTEP